MIPHSWHRHDICINLRKSLDFSLFFGKIPLAILYKMGYNERG